MSGIRYFKLKNNGVFVARIAVEYRSSNAENWSVWQPTGYHDICANGERTVDLCDDAKLKDGTQVRLKAVVVAGGSKAAKDEFTVSSASTKTIEYKIDGTKLINKLKNVTKNKSNKNNKSNVDVKVLVEDALGPEVWQKHLKDDLMHFWDKAEITGGNGLFPTYITNAGEVLSEDRDKWPKEFVEAAKDPNTQGLVDADNNYVRAHSRLTYAFGIAFHMTGNLHYLEVCRKGALALVAAMDGNYGMHVTQNRKTGVWDADYKQRTCQDLAYGLTGLGMYYFLTHDKSILSKIIQLKDFIFKVYMDDGRGYMTWYPKYLKDPQVQIVAQLDQLYAYMLMITPSLPEPYKTEWKKDMKKVADILITQFYSEHYGLFWGLGTDAESMSLGTDHTDFGHSVKTFWVILKIGELLGEPFYIDFARPKIDRILSEAYIEETGAWARRFDADGNLDTDKEWWILAELDQASEILSIHDPYYYRYLNTTQRYWMEHMVDHENGEIWHMVNGKTNEPMIQYPKAHNWKTSLHSFEHALFGYMTASRIKGKECELYYALPEWEHVSHRTVAPYMFFGNVVKIEKTGKAESLPDGNSICKVTFDSIH